MKPVDYDRVASEYDSRYERNRYDGIRACLHSFVGAAHDRTIAEVGCGTGHWLADLSHPGFARLLGLDLSAGMLERAHAAAPRALLTRGTAEQLPWADACLDRVFCVNALHHFRNPQAFISEARRVLRSGGGLLTAGLDPHNGCDRWWIYDFFPAALDADRRRYPPTSLIRDWLRAAGFHEPVTEVAQHLPGEMTFEVAREKGFTDRRATSQLMVISDEDYDAGMKRLRAEQPVLRFDLRVYATMAARS
jgi:ubiquinone/menaquinone biosynthesis C-methylase UbiE